MPPMSGDRKAWDQVGRTGAFGLTVGVSMLVCGWLGSLADRALDTSPVFTALLFLAGGGTALWYGVVHMLK